MEMITYCPECSTANRSGSNFCNSCGTSFTSDLLSTYTLPDIPNDLADEEVVLPTDGLEFFDLENQPWLEPDEDEIGDMLPSVDMLLSQGLEDVEGDQDDDFLLLDSAATPRLVMGVQGLLEPLNIARDIEVEARREPGSATTLGMAPPPPLDPDHARQIRQLLLSEPRLADAPRQATMPTRSSLQIPWLFALLGGIILLAIFLQFPGPLGTPQEWPGLSAAYETVEALPANSHTLVYWAYDPATAGELDWLALPVVQHLLQKKSQLMVISPLPTGPPTARRVIREAFMNLGDAAEIEVNNQRPFWINGGYLPARSATLPLLGQDLRAIPWTRTMNSSVTIESETIAERANLAVVIAAQAEDVQQWLEQVAPRNGVPVLAFVGAGADPILRPYLDSQQLHGLVSGFDGAYVYQKQLKTLLPRNREMELEQHVIAQNWGHFALLLVILLGNLAALVGLKE